MNKKDNMVTISDIIEGGLLEYFGGMNDNLIDCLHEELKCNNDIKIILMDCSERILVSDYLKDIESGDRIKHLNNLYGEGLW